MAISMGQIIKKLRKERNLTQEELAEQLNVTFQAISKWENETGMPDISQIVPLASVFGVSTDVLFGTYGRSDEEEVREILESAYRQNENSDIDLKRRYAELQEGLKKYPNNIWLLFNCLESGNALCYHSGYDKLHEGEIYPECIRMANLIIAYSKEVNDVLRAHMIMVILHSAYGNKEKAQEHAEKFPERSDMTRYVMQAYISHYEKKYADEAEQCKRDILYHYEAMFCSIAQLGEAYRLMKKYDDALKQFGMIFDLISVICADKAIIPPLHFRECGDVHSLIAHTYIEMGDKEKALERLEKMVDYDTTILPQFKINGGWGEGIKQRLLKKLNNADFESIKNEERFIAMLRRANAMSDNT